MEEILNHIVLLVGIPGDSEDKESACNAGDLSQSLNWEDLLEKEMATHPVFLPGEPHGQRRLGWCSPWDHKESDTTEGLNYSQGSELKGYNTFPIV